MSGCVCVLKGTGWRMFSLRLGLGILQSHHWCLRPLWGHRRRGLTRLQANSIHKTHVTVKSPAGPARPVRNIHKWAFLGSWITLDDDITTSYDLWIQIVSDPGRSTPRVRLLLLTVNKESEVGSDGLSASLRKSLKTKKIFLTSLSRLHI